MLRQLSLTCAHTVFQPGKVGVPGRDRPMSIAAITAREDSSCRTPFRTPRYTAPTTGSALKHNRFPRSDQEDASVILQETFLLTRTHMYARSKKLH